MRPRGQGRRVRGWRGRGGAREQGCCAGERRNGRRPSGAAAPAPDGRRRARGARGAAHLQIEMEGGHRADLDADVRALDVNLDQLEPAVVLFGNLLVDGRHHDARPARLRVKVDDNRWVVGEDLLELGFAGHLLDRSSCR
eukprot:scaffold34973_cov84-Isochrysis_galbana.AAC.1